MKRMLCFLLLCCVILATFASCDDGEFSESLDKSFFNYILRDTAEGDVEIAELDIYSREGYCYYHVKYTRYEDGETKEWNAVYRGRYNEVSLYYNLNWENDSAVFPIKDAFYDAVEYGNHKCYDTEEIARYVEDYYKSK